MEIVLYSVIFFTVICMLCAVTFKRKIKFALKVAYRAEEQAESALETARLAMDCADRAMGLSNEKDKKTPIDDDYNMMDYYNYIKPNKPIVLSKEDRETLALSNYMKGLLESMTPEKRQAHLDRMFRCSPQTEKQPDVPGSAGGP